MPENKALFIGINYLGTPYRLRGCANDIKNVKKMLIDNKFVKEANTVTLSDDIPGAGAVTRANIVAKFKEIVKNAEPGSTIFIHYSGHGTYGRDSDSDETDKRDEAICPKTGGNISDDDLRKIIQDLKANVKLVAILDCCHSGTGFDFRNNVIRAIQPMLRGYGVMLSGCLDPQTSADAYEAGENQGALTAAFRAMVAKYGFNKIIDTLCSNSRERLTDLQAKMNTWLKDKGYDQIPNISWEGELPKLTTGLKAANAKYIERHTASRKEQSPEAAERKSQKLRVGT